MPLVIGKPRNKAERPVAQNPEGSAFAGALLCHSSLKWNNHAALLFSRSASRKARFAATCIIETASI
jgi:hypothetical protein